MQLHQMIDSSCITNILVQRAEIITFSQIAGDFFSCWRILCIVYSEQVTCSNL